MKRILIYFQLFLLISSIFLAAVPVSVASPAWTISGNKVYIDDSRVYLEADPHTIASPGWVIFTLQSKQFTGDIDVCWGFDLPTVKPKQAQIYKPYYNNWTTNSSETFYYVSSFMPVGPDVQCDYGFSYDAKHYQVTHAVPQYDEWGNITGWQPTTSLVCFDSYTKNSVNYTITWHEEHSQYIEWQPFTGDFTIINQEHGGMNTWYLLKNVPVEAGKEYVIRAWVDVPISIEGVSGKYWWCIKPSALSLSEAIAQDKFYSLDPWYNVAYSNRKTVRITNPTTETLTNFPAFVNVSWESEMQNDFDDVTFTSLSNDLLPFELDDYVDSDYGLYWLNETIPASSYVDVYMYYGNPGASSLQNPEGVWDSNYVLVSHMRDDPDTSHVKDSTSYANDGTKKAANEPVEAAGAVGKAQSFDGVNDYINFGDLGAVEGIGAITVEAMVYPTRNDREMFVAKDLLNQRSWYIAKSDVTTDNRIALSIAGAYGAVQSTNSLVLNETSYIAGTYNKSDTATNKLRVYINGEREIAERYTEYSSDIPATTSKLYFGAREYVGTQKFYLGIEDEVRISNIERSANWLKSGYEFVVNQSTWVTWGAAETCPCPPYTMLNETGSFWAKFGDGWCDFYGVCAVTDPFTPNDEDCPLTTDGFNLSWSNGTDSGWINGSLPFGPITIDTPPCSWVNVSIWGYNVTYDVLSCDSASDSVYIDYQPPAITYDTGNFFANFSFDAGDYADVTDGFNVSWVDGTGSGWVNTTDSYVNFSYGPHETIYVNITVWSWNSTWDVLSCDYATATARLPNNAPIISGCDNVSFDPENKTVYIYLNYTDVDGDVCMFSTDFPYGSLDPATGVFVWVINGTMNEYYASFTVNDSYGGNDTCIASLMEIYLYFQAVSVTEEQEMLADMWLYLVFALVSLVLLFGSFFVKRGEYYIHIVMSMFSMILAFLLALYSSTDEIGHPELSYIFIAVGIVGLFATVLFIFDALQDIWPMTQKRKELQEQRDRQKAEELFWEGW
jgi:hypothetical protein